MSPYLSAGFWAFCALATCTLSAADPMPSTATDVMKEYVVGKPIRHRNLTLFPVTSRAPKNDNRFITLDEAVKAGSVKIYEKGALPRDLRPPMKKAAPVEEDPFADEGNAVNELWVVNGSTKPLYLMPGEVIIGGEQDRSIAEELIVPPTGKAIPLSVYCVEQGRWGGRDAADYARIITAIGNSSQERQTSLDEQTKEANSGKFIGSVGSLGKGGRLAVSSKSGQGKVWQEVQSANAKASVKSETEAFSRNYGDQDVAKQLAPYLAALQGPIAKTENAIGVIVALDDEIESLDIFESTPLFQKLWPKLLKSYALDAATAIDPEDEEKAKSCTREQALAFLQEVAESKAETEGTEIKEGVATSRAETDRLWRFSAHERRSGIGAGFGGLGGLGGGMGGGFFGGSVHGAAFKK